MKRLANLLRVLVAVFDVLAVAAAPYAWPSNRACIGIYREEVTFELAVYLTSSGAFLLMSLIEMRFVCLDYYSTSAMAVTIDENRY